MYNVKNSILKFRSEDRICYASSVNEFSEINIYPNCAVQIEFESSFDNTSVNRGNGKARIRLSLKCSILLKKNIHDPHLISCSIGV